LIHLLKLLAELDVVGFDIMEVNPHFDVQETTTHLAARVIMETISSIKTNHNSKTAKEEPTETEE
jgi:arginase family enzyme